MSYRAKQLDVVRARNWWCRIMVTYSSDEMLFFDETSKDNRALRRPACPPAPAPAPASAQCLPLTSRSLLQELRLQPPWGAPPLLGGDCHSRRCQILSLARPARVLKIP